MNNDDFTPASTDTGAISRIEFNAHIASNNREYKQMRLALYGSEGTNGMVRDIHDIKSDLRMIKWAIGISVSIVSPIITALILKFIGGI